MSKKTKIAANYRKAKASEVPDCGRCSSMNDDGSCDKVQGKVDRLHVCDLYTPKRR